ncbi:SDR family NAD(P)-dependent oxidoreductase [Pseudoduganella sp. FT93W]|uniref:SDR family NAD(P)-dependent oxidoreductase n=1 Tax=Duganella fentianensis TaxID=2692177 RepID=A0A845I0T7_9BURK|nr:SDR family oxidoreductase [Duganella fentianensis]MYN46742.1 SDR family NAD(P)-dependent oxidoreductase [Duganella fentianensis]
MKVQGANVFITGANRGIGLALARRARDLGAAKVYAGMRNTAGFSEPGLIPVQIDVTDEASVQAAVRAAGDVTILINNAGIGAVKPDALDPGVEAQSREMFETNYFGVVRVTQAFAPVLTQAAKSAIVNVLSSVTWLPAPFLTAYAASKAAAWSYTNSLRQTMQATSTSVLALHVHFVDTDMTRLFDAPKTQPDDVAQQTLAALEAGQVELFADDTARAAKATLSSEHALYLAPQPAH